MFEDGSNCQLLFAAHSWSGFCYGHTSLNIKELVKPDGLPLEEVICMHAQAFLDHGNSHDLKMNIGLAPNFRGFQNVFLCLCACPDLEHRLSSFDSFLLPLLFIPGSILPLCLWCCHWCSLLVLFSKAKWPFLSPRDIWITFFSSRHSGTTPKKGKRQIQRLSEHPSLWIYRSSYFGSLTQWMGAGIQFGFGFFNIQMHTVTVEADHQGQRGDAKSFLAT